MTGTLKGVISALIGLARWKIGNLLLKFFIFRSRKLEKDLLFKRGWAFVLWFHWLFSGRQLYRNRFQSDWKSFAFIALVSAVKHHHPSFMPRLITKNPNLLTEPAKRSSPIVMASIHTGTETSPNRMFEELGVESAVIAASDHRPRSRAALFGFKGTIDIIEISSDTFLIARRKMRDGKVIFCCADFTLREPGTLYHDRYMATAPFDFTKRVKAKVIYAVPLVSEAGEIIINLSEPSVGESVSTAEELARDFIKFISTVTKEKNNYKIGSRATQIPGSLPQYSRYCIARTA